MKNELNKIMNITEQLLNLLQTEPTAKEREQVIHQLNELLEQRDQYIKQLSPPYTAEEEKLGQQIVKMNEQITKKMLSIQNQLKREMKQMKRSKQSAEVYVNPYRDVRSIDGMFLDQKK